MNYEEVIRQEAKSLGFDLVRIMKAQPLPEDSAFFEKWLQQGNAGTMSYLEKNQDRRGNPDKILEGAKSIICLGINYYQKRTGEAVQSEPVRIASYALGRDYHKVIGKKLKKLCAFIQEKFPHTEGIITFASIDTSAIFERSYSQKSGLGFIGKNTCVITREYGSYVFLATILTNLELTPDEPSKWAASCGSCRRCIDSCPTKAINEDKSVDARKCIAYLTIENRDEIPLHLREKVGTWLFGCDICQEVCPHNVRVQPTKVDDFKNIRIDGKLHTLKEILAIETDEAFEKKFAGSPLMRAKRRGLIRNACVVAGNLSATDAQSLIPELKKIASGKDEMLAEHARWALKKLRQPLLLRHSTFHIFKPRHHKKQIT